MRACSRLHCPHRVNRRPPPRTLHPAELAGGRCPYPPRPAFAPSPAPSALPAGGLLYTDANGREWLERARDERATWRLQARLGGGGV